MRWARWALAGAFVHGKTRRRLGRRREAGDRGLVGRVVLDVTTPSSGACTLDVGTTATSATTLSDNLIDGLSVATAAQVADNLGNAGTNGKTRQKLATGKWVTGSVASGASAGIAGYAYIHYWAI